jgi:very-short-patch-repair endonuclease
MRRSDHAYAAARRLRRTLSLPEGLLWRELRGAAGGVKIRRQHPVGPWVIDFYCAAAKLGIEIDGIAHDMGDRPERDARKAAFLHDQGIALLRIPAAEVLRDPQAVAQAIATKCHKRLTT